METMAQKAASSREATQRYGLQKAERSIEAVSEKCQQLERQVADLSVLLVRLTDRVTFLESA